MISFACHQTNANGKCRSGAISANTNVVFVDAKCLRVVVGVAKGRVAISLNILLVARTTPIHIQPKPEIHPCSINWYIVILIKATMIIYLHALGWRSDTLIMHFTIGTINNPTIPNRPMTTTQKRYLLFPSINFDISKISFLFSLILGNLDVKVTQRTIYWAQRLCFTSRWMNSSLHQSLLYTF